jgi:hypothetical protein
MAFVIKEEEQEEGDESQEPPLPNNPSWLVGTHEAIIKTNVHS